MSKQEMDTVVLTLDDDEELECAILGIFNYNDREYIALFPQGDNEYAENGQVFIYRYLVPDDGGEPELGNITDDDEYEAVATEYDRIVN
ncbi:MAG: DUF1292 domain-containing protein [Hespellia sp.]|nr:DUF1292 domain-containing protein [Hespellia sp.]